MAPPSSERHIFSLACRCRARALKTPQASTTIAGCRNKISIHRTFRGRWRYRARGEDARLEWRPDDEADATLDAGREFVVEPCLPPQGIGHGHEEEVRVDPLQEARDEARQVDAHADRLDEAVALQLLDGAPAARRKPVQTGVDLRIGLVEPGVQVMDDGGVDPGQAKAQLSP
jgi:hypothetical protein